MKPILKKSLSYILASVLSITQAFPVAWRQFEKPIKIRAGENMYTAQLYITTDQPLSHKTWLIQDENGVVGDNINEENYYRRLARTATIARYTRLDRNLEEELDKQSREWRNLFLTEKSMDVSETVIKYGSRLEGLLIKEIASHGTSLPADAQPQVILEHATTVFEDYFKDLLERLYAKGKNIIKNKLGLAEEIEPSAEEIAKRNLRRASFQLRDASKILEAHEGKWDIEEAEDFYLNWKRGLVYGLASVVFLEQMRNVNWQTITSNVTINFGEGAGLPLEEILNILDISPLLFRNPEIQNSFNTLETEIAKQKQIFAPIDELFAVDQRLLRQYVLSILQGGKQLPKIKELDWDYAKKAAKMLLLQPKHEREYTELIKFGDFLVSIVEGDAKLKATINKGHITIERTLQDSKGNYHKVHFPKDITMTGSFNFIYHSEKGWVLDKVDFEDDSGTYIWKEDVYVKLAEVDELLSLKRKQEKERDAFGDIRSLATAVAAYSVENKEFPKGNNIDDLEKQIEPTYIRATPTIDPWGNPYIFKSDGNRFIIRSYGSDRKPDNGDSPIEGSDIILENQGEIASTGSFRRSPVLYNQNFVSLNPEEIGKPLPIYGNETKPLFVLDVEPGSNPAHTKIFLRDISSSNLNTTYISSPSGNIYFPYEASEAAASIINYYPYEPLLGWFKQADIPTETDMRLALMYKFKDHIVNCLETKCSSNSCDNIQIEIKDINWEVKCE